MKYIRTKDGIYKAEIANNRIAALDSDGYQASYPLGTFKLHDTIEELKDFYVIDCPQNRKMIRAFTTKREALHYSQDCLRPQGIEHTIYGAIWTDIGLIYVAKMNEKGELELL